VTLPLAVLLGQATAECMVIKFTILLVACLLDYPLLHSPASTNKEVTQYMANNTSQFYMLGMILVKTRKTYAFNCSFKGVSIEWIDGRTLSGQA